MRIGLIAFFLSFPCLALPPHETFIFDGIPSESQVRQWSLLPGTRSYLFKMGNPYSADLEIISRLRGADRIRIEVTSFPGEDSWQAWRKLAGQGVELIGWNAGLPTSDETERLARIGFSRYSFVLNDYPSEAEAGRLKRLGAPVSLTFVRRLFPKYDEVARLKTLDHGFPLLFINDMWPWFSHMDVMRMLPHPKSLRVVGIYPSDDHLEYLRAITGLASVTVDADFEPGDSAIWEKHGAIPVTWLSRDWVPSSEGLRNFSRWPANGKTLRKLVIDQDFPLTSEELERLNHSPVPVEWIHAPPFAL